MIYFALKEIPERCIAENNINTLIYNNDEEDTLEYRFFSNKKELYQEHVNKVKNGFCIILQGKDEYTKLLSISQSNTIQSVFILPPVYKGVEKMTVADVIRITAIRNIFQESYIRHLIHSNMLNPFEDILENIDLNIAKSVLLPNVDKKYISFIAFIISLELYKLQDISKQLFSSLSATDINDLGLNQFFSYCMKNDDFFLFVDSNTIVVKYDAFLEQNGYIII